MLGWQVERVRQGRRRTLEREMGTEGSDRNQPYSQSLCTQTITNYKRVHLFAALVARSGERIPTKRGPATRRALHAHRDKQSSRVNLVLAQGEQSGQRRTGESTWAPQWAEVDRVGTMYRVGTMAMLPPTLQHCASARGIEGLEYLPTMLRSLAGDVVGEGAAGVSACEGRARWAGWAWCEQG